jgi:hypothetical protein
MTDPVVVAAVASLVSLTSSLAFAQVVTSAASGPQQTLISAAERTQEKVKSGDGKSPDDWRFTATIYGWAVNLNGSATVRGNTVNINAGLIDLFQKSSSLAAFMGDFEADNGRFGFFADVVWAQLGIPASAASYANPIAGVRLSLQANAAATLSLTIVEAAGLFEVGKWPGSDQSFTALDAYAGGRFSSISIQINLDLTGTVGFSDPRLSAASRAAT